MIRIEHIKKRFKKLQVLDDVTAAFTKGQVISLIGPNASGKTTLIKGILGMIKPDSGKIYFNDTVINDDFEYRRNIGYMPQIGRYPDNMKIGQLFKMLKHIREREDKDLDNYLVEKFNLPAIYDKPMRTLSGGTRQKVSAALAFLFNPDVLILDEPTAGLDPLSSEILKEKIIAEKNKNKLILITSHILSDLDDLTTHIMYLQEGKMQFFKDMQTLQDETGETRLGKAIARIMKSEQLNVLRSDDTLSIKKGKLIK
jgi:Cu-processing system ATP-binding protein